MKKYISIILLLLCSLMATAQQQPLYSQYMTNYYLVNPAVAGFEKDLNLKAGFRNQWVGFEGAPKTFYLSAETALFQNQRKKGRRGVQAYHGAGGYAYTDNTGPTTRTAALLSYAYHIPLNREIYFSSGVFAGFQQFRFDPNKVVMADNSNGIDPVTRNGVLNAFVPDLSVGTYLHSNRFYVGISLFQLLDNKYVSAENADAASYLSKHLFMSGGYNFDVRRNITLTPSVLLKYAGPAPLQADLNMKGTYYFTKRRRTAYDDHVWTAVSYRTQDALVGLVGLQFKEQYQFSYSYDITVSPLRHHSAGSHELMLGFRIKKTKGYKWLGQNTASSPDQM
ncbi:PorP/SprF family type IX secretion system membrane protein [Rufibacter roseus]|uniref:Type IX secretion system membrane protein PorP/SprF n=1 Tax=Rufibacter roseus TaxID=1567108 RepID=A0ABW2DM48_9BACT|nr:type IX secretion system membrane protein PorP/SprF [Rufibacter roseus]